MSFTPDCHVERSRHIPGSTHRNATGFLDFASLGMTENLFARLGVYQDDSACSAAMNMAIDEALLEYATFPSIRFYRWHCPALSFGYFGRFSDVADHASARDVVRRWTGGGIVFHGDDLTYSIVIPVSDAVCNESSMSLYEKIHRALVNAFNGIGKRAVVAGGVDVMSESRKIAGSAQRRTRRGLLQQGSIQGVELENGLAERFAEELSTNCEPRSLPKAVHCRAREIAARKYATDAWLRKR
ncbi:MAG: hypothetical protein DME92_10835 [Verrucomicrobia bacterium]|nr:MAG: hypothetical protein DME92_10835 [Verrucomicrobiota bacterium]